MRTRWIDFSEEASSKAAQGLLMMFMLHHITQALFILFGLCFPAIHRFCVTFIINNFVIIPRKDDTYPCMFQDANVS